MTDEDKIPSTPDRSISHYREILLLPLILRCPSGAPDSLDKGPRKVVDNLASRLLAADPVGAAAWHEVDRLCHMGPADQHTYQEFLYFHGFIQSFLYGRPEQQKNEENTTKDPWHQRLFAREDLKQLKIDFLPTGGPYKGKTLSCTLNIDRMQLRLFSSGVAIFMVELSLEPQASIQVAGDGQENLNLDHLFTLRDAIRRAYPPYFTGQTNDLRLREYPLMRQWVGTDGDLAKDEYSPAQYLKDFKASPAIPLAPIWQQALAPLIVEGAKPMKKKTETKKGQALAPKIVEGPKSHQPGWAWHHILDERMPAFLFLGSPSAGSFTANDWARLSFVDDAGSGSPYSEAWLDGFEQRHCFDMHWYKPQGGVPYGTRYFFTSYSFGAVGTTNRNDPEDFLPTYIEPHFRRHYFQLGFLNYFQFAALLAMSSWTSDAVARFGSYEHKDSFRDLMRDLQERFLAFTQRCWFTNVSNQLQAREMYARWRAQIGTEALCQEVAKQLGDAWQFLDAEEQAIQAEAATRLSIVATLGVVVGLPAAWLALWSDALLKGRPWWESLAIVLITVGATAAMARFASHLTDSAARAEKRISNPQFHLLSRLLWLLSMTGVAAMCAWIGNALPTNLLDWIAFGAIVLGLAIGMLCFYPRGQKKGGGWLNRAAHWLRKRRAAWIAPLTLVFAGTAWLFLL